jgi:hypothetical protein
MSPDPNLTKTVEDLKEGGWLMAILGALGALLRLLISDEEHTWVVWVRRTIAGAIIGIIAYFAVHGLVPPIYEAVIYSISGTFASEILDVIRRRITRIK